MSSVDLVILFPAFLAGLLVLATHVPLGQLVLERGIVFIDLAIAQVAGLGVVAADAMGWEPQGWSVQISAVSAALLSALFLLWSERRLAAVQEAVIGVVFVVAASAEIILLGFNPHGAEHLKDLLVGQILWVEPRQLLPVAALYAVVLAAILSFDLRRRRALVLRGVRGHDHRIGAARRRLPRLRLADRPGARRKRCRAMAARLRLRCRARRLCAGAARLGAVGRADRRGNRVRPPRRVPSSPPPPLLPLSITDN